MTYLMSDIHGDIAAFSSILSQIGMTKDDHLYIIGDVIDRGPDSIELLRRVRSMQNTTFLMGNHEYMMINRLRHPHDFFPMRLWYTNGGEDTEDQFLRLPEGEREELLRYLENLPVQEEISVNSKTFILVHACPMEKYKALQDHYESETECAVWERLDPRTKLPHGKTVVFGHTPTRHFQAVKGRMRIYFGDSRIGIDCGCAYPWRHGQLGCLRLDDMKEFYSSGEAGEVITCY